MILEVKRKLKEKIKELQEENKWLSSMLDSAILESENKDIYYIIETEYSDKKKEIIKDFQQWIKGKYALPYTKELRKIIKNFKKE